MAQRFFTAAGTILVVLATVLGVIPQASANISQMLPELNKASSSSSSVAQQAPDRDNPGGPLPIAFVHNHGQLSDSEVMFQASNRGSAIFLRSGEINLVLGNRSSQADKNEDKEKQSKRQKREEAPLGLNIRYQGADKQAQVVGANPLSGKANYLLGNDRTKWMTDLETYGGVTYQNLYPGVNLTVDGNEGQVKTTYLVAPHANPAVIQWNYEGAQDIAIDPNGNLTITAKIGTESIAIKETAPTAWQIINGEEVGVAISFAIDAGKTVSFSLPNGYDPAYELIIDPTLSWGSYIGNENAVEGRAIARDSSGNLVITGYSYDWEFPRVDGIPGHGILIVSKLNPTGTELIYSTVLGGSSDDNGYSIAIDAQDNIIVAGETESTDFPIVSGIPTIGGGTCGSHICEDFFIVRLNPSGNAINYSTYLGGSGYDGASSVAVDATGKIYVTGMTISANFPIVNGYNNTFVGGNCGDTTPEPCADIAVAMLDPMLSGTAAILYSSYFGGADWDEGYDIAVDNAGLVYVAGSADSGAPVINSLQPYMGSTDAYLLKINPAEIGSNSLIFSTYWGGSQKDYAYGIAVDNFGNSYLSGLTQSANFPVTNAYQSIQPGSQNAFVSKIDTMSRQPVYSTYLGGSTDEMATDIAIDSAGRAYVVGSTNSSDFPTVQAFQTKGADGCDTAPCQDAFVSVLSTLGNALEFSTFLGGSGNDKANGVLVDTTGNVFVVGTTYSADFPTTTGSYDTTLLNPGSNRDAFIVKIDLTFGTPTPTPTPVSTSQTVSFQNGEAPTASYTGTTDTYISEYSPNSNYNASTRLRADGDYTDGLDLSTLLRWDISSIPENSEIESAYITISVNNNAGNDTYPLYALKRPWVEGQATWNLASTGSPWENPGAAGINDRDSAMVGSITVFDEGNYTFPLNSVGVALVQSWVNSPASNNGLIITHPNNDAGLEFRGSNYSVISERPRLSITYHSKAMPTPTPTPVPLPTLVWNTEGDQASGFFGWSVSSANLNGDAYPDVVVGAPYYTAKGAVFIYYGSDTGYSSTASLMVEGGNSEDRFGWSAGSAGDVNGDGFDDIIVGAVGCSHTEEWEGCAYLYQGSASGLETTPAWTTEGNQSHAAFGYVVGSVGDVNGDGVGDVFIGAPNYSNGESNEGKVEIYFGSQNDGLSSTPNWVKEGDQPYGYFGLAVSSAGDVNGDGRSDLLVGAPNARSSSDQPGAGKAFVFMSTANNQLSTTADWVVEGDQAEAHLGEAVSRAGEINGDGKSEVMVGAPGYDGTLTDEGKVFVFFSSGSSLNTTPDWISTGGQENSSYGISVALAGDVDGNGYADLLVGANRFSNGEANEGKAYLYYVTSSGVADTPGWTEEGNQAYASFGHAVGPAGDVDGNGKDDFLIGATQMDHGQVDEGQILLYATP